MKIKTETKSYGEVMALPRCEHKLPQSPNFLLRLLVRASAIPDMNATDFTYTKHGIEKPGDRPCLILMNHSSFIDLKIASTIFFPRKYSIICTSDGFVGKEGIMRALGCIPTQKFVTDIMLVRDIKYALNDLNCSVLMYPEASYTFDGTKTPLPASLGKLLKMLKVPVVTVITHGAFSRDPLYNGLQLRKVKVSADVTYMFSPEQIEKKTVEELNAELDKVFSFDNFMWQYDNKIEINEPFRAYGLNRILYKCPHCKKEGMMKGEGTHIKCLCCGKTYEMDKHGQLFADDGNTEFSHVPQWYAWEREEVKNEIAQGTYRMELNVDIKMMVDYKSIYSVGKGVLTHSLEGFKLVGCNGELDFTQKPTASYSLYSDYFWYEIGDMICIGDKDKLFYCFPENCGDVVAKARIAAEELYKINRP